LGRDVNFPFPSPGSRMVRKIGWEIREGVDLKLGAEDIILSENIHPSTIVNLCVLLCLQKTFFCM